jgi:hypothetical protein
VRLLSARWRRAYYLRRTAVLIERMEDRRG